MKRFAVILSGCGVYDGAEIHEATLTLLAIDKCGAEYEIFAPNIKQYHVIDHITGKEMQQERNILVESARIARGKISDIKSIDTAKFDALVFPGGFGVAKNLSSIAFDGANCTVNTEIESVIKKFYQAKKPIGALCISPVMIAKVLKNNKVTIGNDIDTAQIIEKIGVKHEVTKNGEVIIDAKHKVFTTPCYMLDAKISDIANGTENIINEMMKYL